MSFSWRYAFSFGIFHNIFIDFSCDFVGVIILPEALYESSLITLYAILFPIKLPFVSAVFWIVLFEAVFSVSAVDHFMQPRRFYPYKLLTFLSMCFLTGKNWSTFDINLISGYDWIYHFICIYQLITRVKYILLSISSGFKLLSLSHTSMYGNSDWNVF